MSAIPKQRSAPIVTRKPTGKPPWPILLLAGAEKSGKSYAAAEASASPAIGRTLWVSVGEDDPDEYGAIPGADFEIVQHDGTWRGILAAVTAAVAQPRASGKPTLIVVDSIGRVWDLLSSMAQADANQRAARNAAKFNRSKEDEDARIAMDQWNTAKDRWQDLLDVIRGHTGPTILTARLEKSTVMNDKGEPTKEKDWKIKAEKTLGSDVGVIVEMPARGEAFLVGVRSLRFKAEQERTPYPGFSVDKLWRDLGVTTPGMTTPRQHVSNLADRSQHIAVINEIALLADRVGKPRAEVMAEWAESHDGQRISDATDLGGLELLRDDLAARVPEGAPA
jgi:hypothetical protein